MDKALLNVLAAAVQSRPIIAQLPDGLRQHAEQFEQMCLEDIRQQTGNPDLTVDEVVNAVRPTISKLIADVWPLVSQVIISLVKKHWPTATISGGLSALISYLVAMLQK